MRGTCRTHLTETCAFYTDDLTCRCCVLQVLTTFTSDARDLLEVRRSEASLKGRVAKLSSRLKVSGVASGAVEVKTC
jgi:hypothetical protein